MKNKVVNAPIKFEKIVMDMINIEITLKNVGFSLLHLAVQPFCAFLLVVVALKALGTKDGIVLPFEN